MTRIVLLLLTLTIASASAQTPAPIDWSNGACLENGIWWPSRAPGLCVTADKAKGAQTFPPPGLGGVVTGATVMANSATPRCPEGWSLVYTGRPMCARELREPE